MVPYFSFISLCLWSVFLCFSCPLLQYARLPHNEIRDLTADLLSEVCHCVSTKPHLQSAEGEALRGASVNTNDGARLDIAANGFWGGKFERAFFMLGYLKSPNRRLQLSSCYRSHENAKKRVYEQRIREVKHGSLVSSVTGGMGRIAATTCKRLASILSSKWNQQHIGMAPLPPVFCASSCFNSCHPGCKIIVWACNCVSLNPY